jgi:hypothetical protein
MYRSTTCAVRAAIKQMKSGKAPGTDNIIPEVLKVDIETSVDMLHPLFEKIWQEEKVPTEWKEGIIVKIPKKVDATNCNNSGGGHHTFKRAR